MLSQILSQIRLIERNHPVSASNSVIPTEKVAPLIGRFTQCFPPATRSTKSSSPYSAAPLERSSVSCQAKVRSPYVVVFIQEIFRGLMSRWITETLCAGFHGT